MTSKQTLVQLKSAKKALETASSKLYKVGQEALGERAWKLVLATDKQILRLERDIKNGR